ncbi:MAG: AAA family ATPase [Magnetococcales bacterium]|nr:AAA family ATPase [Magnetococcales bacterium]
MLTAITLTNFKSHQQSRLPLAPLTVLIGANASGKSNAIEGMRLLSWLAQGQKLTAIPYMSRHDNRVVRGRTEDLFIYGQDSLELGCETDHEEWNRLNLTLAKREDELHISQETLEAASSNKFLYSLDQPSIGHGMDVGVAYNNFSRGGNKPHITCTDQMAIFTQLTRPTTFNANHKTSQEVIPEITRQYEQWLSSMLFLDPVPARMRNYVSPSEKRLQGDGANLSGVLYHLWGKNKPPTNQKNLKSQRADILAFIQSLPEQEIQGLDFLTEPRGGVMVSLTETFGGKSRDYDASLLSDGTLRVLAIAAAMLSIEEGGLVVIEEIDNGVHPSRARHLLERIGEIARRRNLRVLLSTHNPALLDALPDSAIPDVVFCYRDPQDGSSRLSRLEDLQDYPELIAQGSLGYLATSGVLERFVKQTRDPKTRKKLTEAWLKRMLGGDA